MAVRTCCIESCKSRSDREEDQGVRYLKFPKDASMRESWIQVQSPQYFLGQLILCLLQQWTNMTCSPRGQMRVKKMCLRVAKREPENLDAIRDFIHQQSKGEGIQENTESELTEKSNMEIEESHDNKTEIKESNESKAEMKESNESKTDKKESNESKAEMKESNESKSETEESHISDTKMDETNNSSVQSNKDEPMAIATSVMNYIINESAAQFEDDNGETAVKDSPPQKSGSGDKAFASVSLSVGSKVEAKDFADTWYSAEILEVDYDEMEILVRYDSAAKMPEEWINVNSPRLRPITVATKPAVAVEKPKVKPVEVTSVPLEVTPPVRDERGEEKMEGKQKLVFAVGERCLARWRDNRRFTATVHNDLGDGNYEIIFDDGFFWKCSASRLSKWKESSTPSSSGAGPSTASGPNLPFHTHLFDPTRDYLGSKSERREKKRKLNIKEIFNIGQKQKRKETPERKTAKKPDRPKSLPRTKIEDVKVEKKDIPDAIASIIGTVNNNDHKPSTSKGNQGIKQEIKNEQTTVKEEINTTAAENSTEKKDTVISARNELENKEIANKPDDPDSSNVEDKNKERKDQDMSISDEETQDARFSDAENETLDDPDANVSGDQDEKLDPIQKEETKLQNFEKPDEQKHNEQVVRMKEVIDKLQDGLDRELKAASPKIEVAEEKPEEIEPVASTPVKEDTKDTVKEEINEPVKEVIKEPVKEVIKEPENEAIKEEIKDEKKPTESTVPLVPTVRLTQMKPKKRLKLKKKPRWPKHEGLVVKKTKKVVDTLHSKLEQMQMQINAMQMQIQMKDQALQQLANKEVMEAKPTEWCCKWYNGEPVGNVVEAESDTVSSTGGLPRRTVQVQDTRLPEGWKKLMVRRSLGSSAGKWDVVLVSPENRRFHTKTDMRNYLENADPSIRAYEGALLDFAVHLKEARRMGWVAEDSRHAGRSLLHPTGKRKIKVKDKERKVKRRKLNPEYMMERTSLPGPSHGPTTSLMDTSQEHLDNSTLEDGFVYVGSLKVQVIENLLRCPAEGCFKNFRNNTLLQMHIKHYHRELRKMLGKTPKVLDLAYRRTLPTEKEAKPDNKIIKVKLPKTPKRVDDSGIAMKELDKVPPIPGPPKYQPEKIPRSLDSPLMRQMQVNRPVKRPRVLLPVRRPDPVEPPDLAPMEDLPDFGFNNSQLEPSISIPPLEILDFETAISTHTVTRPIEDVKKKSDKRKVYATISKAPLSEDEEVLSMNSDVETRSSFPRSGTPDSKTMEVKTVVPVEPVKHEPPPAEETPTYMYTETGECIKLERMKREEIINCHCGFREEDGLMVQCELCLCWQHAHCYNIQRESDVPKKYTCYICLNPRRGRRSQRFLQDQDRMTEGLLAGGRPSARLRRTHDLSAALLRVNDALHALRLKYHVASKKNHPKLYLWASDWDSDSDGAQEPDKHATMDIGKENMPLQAVEGTSRMDLPDIDQLGQREGSLSGHSLLGGLLSSPGGPSLDMPISTTELEKLANSVAEPEPPAIVAPQPEAAIDNAECLQKLLKHMQRCQTLLDAKLDKLEAEIVELEAQDPMFEDDESPDYFPRTKQTIQMLLRDLGNMETLGVLT